MSTVELILAIVTSVSLVVGAISATYGIMSRSAKRREEKAEASEKIIRRLVSEEFYASAYQLAEDLKGRQDKLDGDLKSRQDELDAASVLRDELVALYQKIVNSGIPLKGHPDEGSLPSMSVKKLKDAKLPEHEALAHVGLILDNESSSSEQLETAGDYAQNQLEDYRLAEKCYQRAIDRRPGNWSAKAELLALALKTGDREQITSAEHELTDLIIENPYARDQAIRVLLNHYIEVDDYAAMETLCEGLRDRLPLNSMVLRNIAVARMHLDRPPEEIMTPAEDALTIARRTGSDGDYCNTVRAYAPWLVENGCLDRAKEVVRTAVSLIPQIFDLYLVGVRIALKEADYEAARKYLNAAGKFTRSQNEVYQVGVWQLVIETRAEIWGLGRDGSEDEHLGVKKAWAQAVGAENESSESRRVR